MTNNVYIPWELTEQILSYVPPESLVRFKTVCKQWNALFNNKTFINNHKATFRFIIATKSKIYSVSVDPEIAVRELNLNVGSIQPQVPEYMVDCNEFVVCGLDKGVAVWNPWLPYARKIKIRTMVKAKAKKLKPMYQCHGIGYDSKRNYKTIWSYRMRTWCDDNQWKVHDFASLTWKDVCQEKREKEEEEIYMQEFEGVSLDGTLYWIVSLDEDDPLLHLAKFDFSRERFSVICDLPCVMNDDSDVLVLRVFNGDKLSLLKQCHATKKIEIWVTKKNDDMVWVNFMTFSDPNIPSLEHDVDSQPSYFIDDDKNQLVVCTCDERGQVWIYVMGENKLMSKTQIDYVADRWPLHCTHFPSLASVPKPPKRRSRITTSLF